MVNVQCTAVHFALLMHVMLLGDVIMTMLLNCVLYYSDCSVYNVCVMVIDTCTIYIYIYIYIVTGMMCIHSDN